MARVTATEVKEIMDNCTVTDDVTNVYINTATLIIDSVFSGVTSISTDLLKEIERWFTAHMIASVLHRTATEEKLGDASVKYAGNFGENLSSTPYGQMVKQIDITGRMIKSSKAAVSLYAIPQFD